MSGVVQFIVSTILVFITIPLFVQRLGADAYGVYSLIAVVGSLNTFANLGLSASLVRFLAAQGKTAESDLDIIITFCILICLLLPLTVCGIVFKRFILTELLNVPASLFHDAGWLYIAILCSTVMLLLGGVFTAILDSQQKIYLTNVYQMIYNIVNSCLLLLVLLLGWPLKMIAFPIVISTTIWFCIVVLSGSLEWGTLSFAGIRRNGLKAAKKQLAYGIQIYLSGLVLFLYEPLTKILIAHYIGVIEVGIFEIGLRARNQIYGFMTKLLYPLYPMISKLIDKNTIRNIVHDVEQKTFFISLPIAGIVILVAKPLVSLFFHANVHLISVTVICIVSGYLVGSITVTPLFQYLTAKGHATLTIFIQGINVVVNALVFIVLYRPLGYYAVIAANMCAIFASFSYLLYLQYKIFNSLIFDSVKQVFIVLITLCITILLGTLINTVLDKALLQLVFSPFVAVLTSLIVYRRFSLITSKDIEKYFGKENKSAKYLIQLLCKQHA